MSRPARRASFLCSGSGRRGLAGVMEGQGRHELGRPSLAQRVGAGRGRRRTASCWSSSTRGRWKGEEADCLVLELVDVRAQEGEEADRLVLELVDASAAPPPHRRGAGGARGRGRRRGGSTRGGAARRRSGERGGRTTQRARHHLELPAAGAVRSGGVELKQRSRLEREGGMGVGGGGGKGKK
jgi:hypothetical protein